jgi:uncharacterized membrane protein
MIISRIGSLIVEPLLKKIKIIEFSNYKKFITASSIDDKVELFSEINNMYRTFLSMLIILLIIVIYENTPMLFELSHTTKFVIVLLSLIILFLLSYRKQTEYINKRIDSQSNEG